MRRKVGIKFCGGCNPNYDRVAALERIRSRLVAVVEFVRFDRKDTVISLAIKGCDTECFALNRFDGKPLIVLTRWEDIDRVSAQIESL